MSNMTLKSVKIFDLKTKNLNPIAFQGSTVDRTATEKEKLNPCPTLKDNDFLDEKRTIDLGTEQKKVFMEKLRRDVNVRLNVFPRV